MRISTLIRISLAAAILVVLGLATVSWFSQSRFDLISAAEERAQSAAYNVSKLLLLTHEYLLYGEERSAQQWATQQSALVEKLTVGSVELVAISPNALAEAKHLPVLFQVLSVARSGETDFHKRQANFLVDQILNSIQIISDSVKRWEVSASRYRKTTDKQFKVLALTSPIIMLLILLILSTLLTRRILSPLKKLHEAVLAVARGDLTVHSDSRAKDELGDLSRTFDAMAVDLVTELRTEIAERKQVEKGLQESEARFRLLVENAPDAIFVQTRENFAYLNKAATQLFGADSPGALIGMPVIERFHPEIRESVKERIRILNQEQQSVPLCHEVCLRMDNTPVDVEVTAVPMTYEGNAGALVFARDITERIAAEETRKSLEYQIHQSQKIESVGRLAGGVAHDYNNMLSVIIGRTELAQMRSHKPESLHNDLDQILGAAMRSRDITQKLLAFARKQIIDPRVLDLNETVESMLTMLKQLLGENIDLVWQPKENLWPVKMDPTQMDQILANLCINARDAIADVGKMTIETRMVSLDQAYCRDHAGFIPGDFVMLAVSDDGCGMDKETLDKIYEPFFTTKPTGKGTGLGLSMVYGVVKQSNGFINVYSEPGDGTTFRIYLPRHTGQISEESESTGGELLKGQGETVLVVEDEVSILALIEEMLSDFGYKVLAANSPAEALDIADAHPGEIHLLITDVVMPEMNGRVLAGRLQSMHPQLKCLYMSGYTANVIAHHGVLDKGIHFIQKPFSRIDFSVQIRTALDL
ncbi:MAG: ATP-binding protein [Desulfuromonadales bacterium]